MEPVPQIKIGEGNVPSETKPSLQSHPVTAADKFEVVPLRFRDMLKGIETVRKGFASDSLAVYLRQADTYPFPDTRRIIAQCLAWISGIYHKRTFTIGGIAGVPAVLKFRAPRDNHNYWIISFLLRIASFFNPPKLNTRRQQGLALNHTMVTKAFGEKAADMYEIQVLVTDPHAQGRGYGKALVKYVLDKSDTDGHDIYVLTTEAYRFYCPLGFSVIESSPVGESDPEWASKPPVVRLMYRPSKLKV